jgi:hypothetical protein
MGIIAVHCHAKTQYTIDIKANYHQNYVCDSKLKVKQPQYGAHNSKDLNFV